MTDFTLAYRYRGYLIAFPADQWSGPWAAYVFRANRAWRDPILVTSLYPTVPTAARHALDWLKIRTGLLGRLGWPNRLANYLLRPLRGWWYGAYKQWE